VSVAFLAANNVYWRIRLEDGGRTVICYKNRDDPGAATADDRTTQCARSAGRSRPSWARSTSRR